MLASTYQLKVDEIDVEVIRRRVKYLRLYVRPPDGRVRVVAPLSVSKSSVRDAIAAKLAWIRHHQEQLAKRPSPSQPKFVDGALHLVAGVPHRLQVELRRGPARVEVGDSGSLRLCVRPEATEAQRQTALEQWYRERLQAQIPALIAHWQATMGVQVAEWGIKRMKTRWGSCNTRASRIWLNLELAKRPAECLEYVLVHELAHLLEPSHNARFKSILDQHLPDWRVLRARLNEQPLA